MQSKWEKAMSLHRTLSRRSLLKAAGGFGAALLTGCDEITQSATPRRILASAEKLNIAVQRGLGRKALATEFGEGDLSASFRANGTTNPDTQTYKALAGQGFAEWRLDVGGLVSRPAQLSMTDLRSLPSRTQITRHDCVEGWSCIGKWTGTRLSALLAQVDLRPNARYVVFHCADELPAEGLSPPVQYYESIDLEDALHEQTILAYEMNGRDLPIEHGAPLRLRVERQLGYKHAKYVMSIEVVDSLDKIGGGNGSYWADHGYSWYAGI
jgi:DMSO/TMAO reductase YedYZ molybdopterin-dependent catalytic subunit